MTLPTSPSSSFAEATDLPLGVDGNLILIPGLPNDVAAKVLSCLPYSHLDRVKVICKTWRFFLSSKTLSKLRHLNGSLSKLLCIFPEDPTISSPYLFDPVHLAWRALPPMPCNPHMYGLCNFTSIAVGTNIYVLGGSVFDTRSYPLDRPCSSSAVFRFDFITFTWHRLAPMLSQRGSFACVALPSSDHIIVAGGGSRHNLFTAAGTRLSSVERYDIQRDKWVALEGLPRFRAGCVGFLMEKEENKKEFWVMGGYGQSRTLSGIFPVDEQYSDAVVMEVKHNDGNWREVGDMWADGERSRLGKIAVLESEDKDSRPGIFMLDGNDIFRYEISLNRWKKESSVGRKAPINSSFGFVVLGDELYVMSLVHGLDSSQTRKTRQQKRLGNLFVQIYKPSTKTWRTLVAKPPFHSFLDFKSAVLCTIAL